MLSYPGDQIRVPVQDSGRNRLKGQMERSESDRIMKIRCANHQLAIVHDDRC